MLANVDTTSLAQFEPSRLFQVFVGSADGIRMNAKPPRQFPCAGQPSARLEIFAQYREDNLRCQLLANWYFAGMRNPETHTCCLVVSRMDIHSLLFTLNPRRSLYFALLSKAARGLLQVTPANRGR